MYLPDMIGWELHGPSDPEDLGTELQAMVGLPVDAIVDRNDEAAEEVSLRGVMLEARGPCLGDDGLELVAVVAGPATLLRFECSGYEEGSCIPGYIEARFEECSLELGRVTLPSYRDDASANGGVEWT
jgi:hypothetical protein